MTQKPFPFPKFFDPEGFLQKIPIFHQSQARNAIARFFYTNCDEKLIPQLREALANNFHKNRGLPPTHNAFLSTMFSHFGLQVSIGTKITFLSKHFKYWQSDDPIDSIFGATKTTFLRNEYSCFLHKKPSANQIAAWLTKTDKTLTTVIGSTNPKPTRIVMIIPLWNKNKIKLDSLLEKFIYSSKVCTIPSNLLFPLMEVETKNCGIFCFQNIQAAFKDALCNDSLTGSIKSILDPTNKSTIIPSYPKSKPPAFIRKRKWPLYEGYTLPKELLQSFFPSLLPKNYQDNNDITFLERIGGLAPDYIDESPLAKEFKCPKEELMMTLQCIFENATDCLKETMSRVKDIKFLANKFAVKNKFLLPPEMIQKRYIPKNKNKNPSVHKAHCKKRPLEGKYLPPPKKKCNPQLLGKKRSLENDNGADPSENPKPAKRTKQMETKSKWICNLYNCKHIAGQELMPYHPVCNKDFLRKSFLKNHIMAKHYTEHLKKPGRKSRKRKAVKGQEVQLTPPTKRLKIAIPPSESITGKVSHEKKKFHCSHEWLNATIVGDPPTFEPCVPLKKYTRKASLIEHWMKIHFKDMPDIRFKKGTSAKPS